MTKQEYSFQRVNLENDECGEPYRPGAMCPAHDEHAGSGGAGNEESASLIGQASGAEIHIKAAFGLWSNQDFTKKINFRMEY